MINKLLAGQRVLVVEDELLVLMMIEDILADLGCEAVVAAGTVEKALAAIDAQVIDLAMLDMNLNGDTNPAVAEALAARGIPFRLLDRKRRSQYERRLPRPARPEEAV